MILCPPSDMSDVNGTVVAIQGRDVDSAAPNDGDVYQWDAANSKWVPVALAGLLGPWVGTPNTQAQVIQRIPYVASITATGGSVQVSTGVTYTLPAGSVLSVSIWACFRNTSSFAGAVANHFSGVIANVSGTMTTPHDISGFGGSSTGSGTGLGYSFVFDVSGSDVTINAQISAGTPGNVIDIQGYVDLMVM